MTNSDFWRNSTVVVIGGGQFASVIMNLCSPHCKQVRAFVRDPRKAELINLTRTNPEGMPEAYFSPNITAFSDPEKIFDVPVSCVFWAIPANACRDAARKIAPMLSGSELMIHTIKGVEEGSFKRVSEILLEELPTRRIGVLSGPNLAREIILGEVAAAMIASHYDEVIEAGKALLQQERFLVYGTHDLTGVEWAGVLKNILAIAAGAIDAYGLKMNSRSFLITRGLEEMVRFCLDMGGETETLFGLAGIGDLLVTTMSPLSRNYRVGRELMRGKKLDEVLRTIESTAEGVRSALAVRRFAIRRGISMPITECVCRLLRGELNPESFVRALFPLEMDRS